MYQRTVESAEYSEASKKWLVKVRNASSGKELHNKNVLVVGSGNSGIEIALDLANPGAKTSIIVQSQQAGLWGPNQVWDKKTYRGSFLYEGSVWQVSGLLM
uniref:indole-3-pyruvate monooxygenase n=1 Tax=Quercus lobata TaxID=97700 RepID=A0A7N2N2Y2_QUELO